LPWPAAWRRGKRKMAVQFNLLPDVKLEFDRQQRTKRLVYGVSMLVSAVVLAVFIFSFVTVDLLQKKLLSDANNNITTYSKKLKAIPDLDKVLTIQNQLSALPALHQSKHVSSRFFTYLKQITPSKIFVGQVTLDMSTNKMTIGGTSDTLATINAFVDTLKFTQYKTSDQSDSKPAFNSVVLSSSGRSDKNASYSVDAAFDPALFDGTQTVSLVVPKEVTTRSVTEAPDINNLLFNGQTGQTQQGTQ
jgi:hypothetical protein